MNARTLLCCLIGKTLAFTAKDMVPNSPIHKYFFKKIVNSLLTFKKWTWVPLYLLFTKFYSTVVEGLKH